MPPEYRYFGNEESGQNSSNSNHQQKRNRLPTTRREGSSNPFGSGSAFDNSRFRSKRGRRWSDTASERNPRQRDGPPCYPQNPRQRDGRSRYWQSHEQGGYHNSANRSREELGYNHPPAGQAPGDHNGGHRISSGRNYDEEYHREHHYAKQPERRTAPGNMQQQEKPGNRNTPDYRTRHFSDRHPKHVQDPASRGNAHSGVLSRFTKESENNPGDQDATFFFDTTGGNATSDDPEGLEVKDGDETCEILRMEPQRKRRKIVPGGSISKVLKRQEFASSLYCSVCNEHFRDQNTELAHMRSKKHKDKAHAKRAEALYSAAAAAVGHAPKLKKDDPEHAEKEVVKSFMTSLAEERLFPPFADWVTRSLKEASRIAKATNNASVVGEVRRELVFVWKKMVNECSMRKICWDRERLATGISFQATHPSSSEKELVFSEEQAAAMEARAVEALSTAPENDFLVAQPAAATPEKDAKQKQASVESARHWVPDASSRVGAIEEASPVVAPPPRTKKYRERATPVRWTSQVSKLLKVNVCDTEVVRSFFLARFEEEKPKPASFEHSLEPHNKYEEAKKMLKAETVDVQKAIELLQDAVNDLQNPSGGPVDAGLLQECLKLLMSAAVDYGQFGVLVEASFHLLDSVCNHDLFVESDLIGYCYLSSLFSTKLRSKYTVEREGGVTELTMSCLLRQLPKGSVKEVEVWDCFQLLRHVISNSWVKFFKNYEEGSLRLKNKLLSQISKFVRERAFVTMLKTGVYADNSAFAPPEVAMRTAMRSLGWEQRSNIEDFDPGFQNAKQFLEELPQDFEVKGGRDGFVTAESTEAQLRNNTEVNVYLLRRLAGSAFKLV